MFENDNLETIARKMLDYRISSLPIIDNENRPIDVICKTDIAYALADAKNFKVMLIFNIKINNWKFEILMLM